MNPPKSFKVDGKKWTVKVDKLPDDLDGMTEWDTRTITISPTHTEPFDEILLHEILHACAGKEVDLYLDGKDELLVTLMAPRLLSVLKQINCWK